MKKMFIAFALVFFVLYLPASLASQSLDWQIQFFSGKNRESRPVNEIIKMENGDLFSLIIKADSDCYLYAFWYDSERNIEPLPASNQLLRKDTEENFNGPFFITEPSGTETIYVIMSLSRQTNLERLIENFEKQSSRQNSNNLFREIGSLQNSVSRLGEPATAIITSGATSRSSGTERQNFATRFSGNNLYVRTITISH